MQIDSLHRRLSLTVNGEEPITRSCKIKNEKGFKSWFEALSDI